MLVQGRTSHAFDIDLESTKPKDALAAVERWLSERGAAVTARRTPARLDARLKWGGTGSNDPARPHKLLQVSVYERAGRNGMTVRVVPLDKLTAGDLSDEPENARIEAAMLLGSLCVPLGRAPHASRASHAPSAWSGPVPAKIGKQRSTGLAAGGIIGIGLAMVAVGAAVLLLMVPRGSAYSSSIWYDVYFGVTLAGATLAAQGFYTWWSEGRKTRRAPR